MTNQKELYEKELRKCQEDLQEIIHQKAKEKQNIENAFFDKLNELTQKNELCKSCVILSNRKNGDWVYCPDHKEKHDTN